MGGDQEATKRPMVFPTSENYSNVNISEIGKPDFWSCKRSKSQVPKAPLAGCPTMTTKSVPKWRCSLMMDS
jgi:hypothetical protein